MYGDYDSILEKLVEKSDLDKGDIEDKIEEKQVELSGLVSKEGAAHIVAKELGIQLLDKPEKKNLEIKNIVSGMRNVSFSARITGKTDVREFEKKDGSKGRVQNLFLSDGTSTIRMPLWNEDVDKYEQEKGDVVDIKGAYIVEDNYGKPEVRLGRGTMTNGEDDAVPALDDMDTQRSTGGRRGSGPAKRTTLKDVESGQNAEVRASIVQVFETDPFYEVCPDCGKSVKEEKCKGCDKEVEEPDHNMVVSGIVDDGYGNMRFVAFRDVAEKLIGMSTKDALDLVNKKKDRTYVTKNPQALGKEYVFTGRTRENSMFNRLEFILSNIDDFDPEEETKAIINKLGAKE